MTDEQTAILFACRAFAVWGDINAEIFAAAEWESEVGRWYVEMTTDVLPDVYGYAVADGVADYLGEGICYLFRSDGRATVYAYNPTTDELEATLRRPGEFHQ